MAVLDISHSNTLNITRSTVRDISRNAAILTISSSGILGITQPEFAP